MSWFVHLTCGESEMELARNKFCNFMMMYTVFRKKNWNTLLGYSQGARVSTFFQQKFFFIILRCLHTQCLLTETGVNPNHNCNIRPLNFKFVATTMTWWTIKSLNLHKPWLRQSSFEHCLDNAATHVTVVLFWTQCSLNMLFTIQVIFECL